MIRNKTTRVYGSSESFEQVIWQFISPTKIILLLAPELQLQWSLAYKIIRVRAAPHIASAQLVSKCLHLADMISSTQHNPKFISRVFCIEPNRTWPVLKKFTSKIEEHSSGTFTSFRCEFTCRKKKTHWLKSVSSSSKTQHMDLIQRTIHTE